MTRPHSTHHDDCGCLSERHAQQIADANAAIKRLTRERDEATIRAYQVDKACEFADQEHAVALAAAEARERELREALTALTACVGYAQAKARYGPLFGNKCTPAIRAADAALSRPPGSREALRAMLLQCAGAVWATAAPSVEMDSAECAAIVARLLPEGGEHE